MKKLLFFFLTLLPFLGMRAESTIVGATDNSAGWWTAFSQDYTINKGEVWHFQFTNHNDEGDVWHNYVLAITSDANRNDNANGYKEYLMMRADNHSWGDGTTARQWTYTDANGRSFIQEMNGATVDMTVLYDENNTFYVNSTITTSSGRTFMHNAQTTGADGSQCRLFFVVQNAHIEITTAEKVSRLAETRAGLDNSWTMIAGADDLKAKAQSGEYFFAIADASRDVMVSWYDNTLAYRQSVNPVEHLTRLFYIEAATVGSDGNAAAEGTEVYNLRNVEHSKYLMQTGNKGQEFSISYNDQAITVSWTNLDIAFPNNTSVCTMAWHMHNNGNNYFGAWDGFPDLNTMPLDGTENLAGNKSGSNIGTYVIYAISRNEFLKQYIGKKTNVDLTKFIINPSFESDGWNHRGNFLGWNQIEGNTVALELVDNTSLTNKDGSRYAQRYHSAGTYGVQQTISHLPQGAYKVDAATSYSGSSSIAKLFANDDEYSFIGTNLESSIITTLTDDDSSLTFGAKITNVGSDRWFAVDNFRLTYIGENLYLGEATANYPKYLQPGQTVTISYNDIYPTDKTVELAAETNVTIDDTKVDVTLTDNQKGFTFTIPAGVQPSTEYTLSIPAGTIGNAEAGIYNEPQEITLTTANIFDGTYYLATTSHNGEQMFLSRGAHYGTEASVDMYGLAVQVVTANDNTTTFKFIDNEAYLFHDNNTAIFADGGEATAKGWKTHKTEGGFTIDFEGGNTVRVDEGGLGIYLHTNNATSDHRVTWYTVTKEQRDAIIAAYPEANKTRVAIAAGIDDFNSYLSNCGTVDFTNKILNNKSGEQGAWEWHGVDRNPTFNWTESNTCFEWYNGSGYATQTINNLVPGVYKVTVDAIDRLSSVNQENKVRSLGYVENLSYFKANGEQVRIKNWYDMHEYYKSNGDPGYPYWRDASAQCMTDGYATVEVYAYVGDDGKLELEINKPSYTFMKDHREQSNFVFNNFTLTYLGDFPLTDSRTTLQGKYGTICLPYDAETTNAEVYTAEVNGNVVELTEAPNGIEAGVPYVFKATADAPSFSYTAGTIVNTPVNEGVLKGSFEQITVPVGAYVLQTQNGIQSFYKVYEGHQPKMSAYRAYLKTENNARELTFGTDETAIEALNALINGEAKIYDLNGRQLQHLQKGVNIVNGKKFIVK